MGCGLFIEKFNERFIKNSCLKSIVASGETDPVLLAIFGFPVRPCGG